MIKKENISYSVDYLIIIFFSFFINYYYSNLGVLPQDTFAYYDTAYRILHGSAPFKDYWTVSGPFIDYLQAAFFFIFGVSWKSYILSGSIINSITTVIFFYLLKNLNLNRIYSLFYALSFSVLANPSMGVPFADHYSTFLSLIGIFFFLLAIKNEIKTFWFLIPILFFFAFFSKQSPSSYILIVLVISLIIFIYFSKKFFFLKYLITSSIFCFLLFFVFCAYYKINFGDFIDQYIFFPQTIAEDRLKNYEINFEGIVFQFKFIYLFLIPLIFINFKLIRNTFLIEDCKILYSITLILLTFVLIFHQIITKNFIFIFFLIPMLTSLIHINLNNFKRFRKIISIILISTTFLLTLKYHLRFNEERKMLNLENISLNNYIDSSIIHPDLKGLKWVTREYYLDPNIELSLIKDSLQKIKEDKSKKMMLSRYLFFSATLGENLENPSRWPSIGDASNPNENNVYHEGYKKFIKDLIISKKIKTLYTTLGNEDDIFTRIFVEKCLKTEVINDFLTKHDITNCIKQR